MPGTSGDCASRSDASLMEHPILTVSVADCHTATVGTPVDPNVTVMNIQDTLARLTGLLDKLKDLGMDCVLGVGMPLTVLPSVDASYLLPAYFSVDGKGTHSSLVVNEVE